MLRERLKQLAAEYPRYGYELLHGMLKAEGLVVNEKKTYRIYREEKLQVRRKRRKRLLARDRVPMPIPEEANQRWSIDFVSDQLATGRRFRVLNVVDDYSRECIGQIVDTSITGERVSRLLDRVMLDRSRPEAIVTDNGPEFTSKAMHLWSQRTGVTLRFIQPGKPIQNALVESFNGKFRDACLNEHWFLDLADARRIEWRVHYNTVRPHSSLGFLSPELFRMAGELWKSRSLCDLGKLFEFSPFPQPRRRRTELDLNWGEGGGKSLLFRLSGTICPRDTTGDNRTGA